MTISNMHSAKTNLSKLVNSALSGKDVFIAKNNKPVVKLETQFIIPKNKIPGLLAGKIKLSTDFLKEDLQINTIFYGE